MPFIVEFPDGTHSMADCDFIKDARVEAFNQLQRNRSGFSARIYRLSRGKAVAEGFVNDDGMWTRGSPSRSDFFTPGSAMFATWKPICTVNPIMYNNEAEHVFFYDAKLFSRESAVSRYVADHPVCPEDVKAERVDLEPTFGQDRVVCWTVGDSPRSHPFWEVEVVS